MTSLAWTHGTVHLGGRGSPPAGDIGNSVVRITVDALSSLKTGITASSSWVFNDLHSLAQENETTVRDNATFDLAQRFLLALPGSLPAPELALDEDGEIAMDWRSAPDRMLTMTLRADGLLTYACLLGQYRRKHGTELFADAVPQEIIESIQQVAFGR